jgi:hypothetical protein
VARAPLAIFALVSLAALGSAGCLAHDTTPGPDNPQLTLYRTSDGETQVVVRGAFKDQEYDRVNLTVMYANGTNSSWSQNDSFLFAAKVPAKAFGLRTTVSAGAEVYKYGASYAPAGAELAVTETGPTGAPVVTEQRFPVVKILEVAASGGHAG